MAFDGAIVAELAVEVRAPAIDRATGRQAARVDSPATQRAEDQPAGHRHRDRTVCCGGVPQLAAAVTAPTVCDAGNR